MGGRIPDGIMRRDARRIPEWLNSVPLTPSLFYFLTPSRAPCFNPDVLLIVSLLLFCVHLQSSAGSFPTSYVFGNP